MPAINKKVVKDDWILIEKCLNGDQKAYSELFFTYKDLVYRVVYKLIGAGADADDAVQQTFVELFKSLQGFKGKAKFTTWLYRIASNVAVQHLRKRRPKSIEFTTKVDPETLADNHNANKDELLEKKEHQNEIFEVVRTLPEKKRVVIVLHDMEGKTMDEVAEIIGVPVGTVKSRLFHARDELRKKLKKILCR